jgi:hypothetical protein
MMTGRLAWGWQSRTTFAKEDCMSRAAATALTLAAVGATACGEPAGLSAGPLLKNDPASKTHFFFDQEQPLIDPSLTPLALYPLDPDPTAAGPFKQNLAQTFTPSADVELRYLYLPLACAAGVQARIQIRAGGPDGAVIWDRNYNLAKIVADGEFLNPQIYGGLALTGGATYAIVLSAQPTGAGETTCSIISAPAGDSYGGGQAFFNNPGFSPYWVPFSTFPGPDDLPFRTLVR